LKRRIPFNVAFPSPFLGVASEVILRNEVTKNLWVELKGDTGGWGYLIKW
jgi:hypothetical protein